ncbi:MAG: cytochrome c oxidase assembly protein [Actinobacteria bacterium]|nr:cytochrome c oxidase assembly protein [Actinomycetota bacterium]
MISFDPGGLAVVLLLVGLYVRAVRVLHRRGFVVPRTQQLAWYWGVGMIAVGLLGPLDRLAGQMLTAHMAQHMLVADLAAPFLLAGVRTPVLMFIPPRAVLVWLARRRHLRALFRVLRRPLVALPIYVGVFYTWHFAFAFDAALRNDWLHAIQHQAFLAIALLLWWPVIEPMKRHMRGDLWKIGYVLGTRVLVMFVGMSLVVGRHPAYAYYADRGNTHGLTPLTDQQLAGGLMMSVDIVVMMAALAYFFWRASLEADRAEGTPATAR